MVDITFKMVIVIVNKLIIHDYLWLDDNVKSFYMVSA